MRNREGLTLIELIIVLAVIAIIGAILIPNFISTTDKARLKSDIQSARVLQNAVELYNAEQSRAMSAVGLPAVITELGNKGYIKAGQAVIQTEGAQWAVDAEKGVVVDISGCGPDVKRKTFNQLSDTEKWYVRGGSGADETPAE